MIVAPGAVKVGIVAYRVRGRPTKAAARRTFDNNARGAPIYYYKARLGLGGAPTLRIRNITREILRCGRLYLMRPAYLAISNAYLIGGKTRLRKKNPLLYLYFSLRVFAIFITKTTNNNYSSF